MKIPVTLFQDAVYAVEELGKGVNDPEKRDVAFNEFLSRNGYTFLEASRLASAMEFRLQALLRLKDEHGLLDWDIPDKRTSDEASGRYLTAAAMEPLIQHHHSRVSFDPERFRARLTDAPSS